jgi:hypothetical protein
MSKPTRRRFLGASAATLPLGLGIGAMALPAAAHAARAASSRADLVLTGATVITMDPALPQATALAVKGERILTVGSDAEIEALAGRGTQRIDARGLTVTPGFIDAHSHPLFAEEAIAANVNLPTIAQAKAALTAQAAKTPPGHWVRGTMYDDTIFAERRPLTRRDLDDAVPDHPVFVGHRGGHTAVVNSRAFALAGITLDTPDPTGGRYYRENGEFTGKVAELALDTFRKVGNWPVLDREARRRSVALVGRAMAASGLTSTTDARGNRDDFLAYQDAREHGELYQRIAFMPGGNQPFFQAMKEAGLRSGFGDAMLRIGAVKYAADGSASERTMRMSTPFAGRPEDYGILTMDQAQIDAAVDDAVAAGFRIGIHANGDVTIAMVLNAYERVLKDWKGPNPRFRIEHCSLVNPELIARIKAAGVIPTPFYTYAYYHGEKWLEYGEEKMRSMFAHRSFLDAGIPVAPASDFTPGPYEPMMALQSLVTRKDTRGRVWGANQRVSVEEALGICTVNGAFASFEEDIKGSLTPGKLADFVILEHDPRRVEPDELVKNRVLRTVCGGVTTHAA